MADFADSVFGVFSDLQEQSFVPAYAYSGKHFASLFKKLMDDVFLYVFVHDGRPSDSELSVSMWIAPPHGPGDGLDKLYVGFKLLIASAFEIDDEFFRSSQARILSLLPNVHYLSDVVVQEIKSPAFETQRYKAYMMERAAFDALKRCKKAKPAVASFAKQAAGKRVSYEALEKTAIAAAENLIDEGIIDAELALFYGTDAKFLGRSLVGLLYVQTLACR